MFLKFGDVFMSSEGNGCLMIRTSEKSYIQTRTILVSLADQTGMPLSLYGENCANVMCEIAPETKVITTDGIARLTNEFLIPAWKINIKGEQLRELALELKTHLEAYGLNVIINM